MLKSTDNTFTREQFVMLRKARSLIKGQFDAELSLHSEHVVRDVYAYAVHSDTNELFRLFTDLNELSGNALENPLNEEQFILLREAKGLIAGEFAEELALVDPDVMSRLYEFALWSEAEVLFDIYRYLMTRERECEKSDPLGTGSYYGELRKLLRLAIVEFQDEVPASYEAMLATLPSIADRSNQPALVELISGISQWQILPPSGTELLFSELSAPDFERLREAKHAIEHEFAERFSLHAKTTLDELYAYALKSEEEELFDLFCDLLTTQVLTRRDAAIPGDWIDKDQFKVLRGARAAIRDEFGETIELRSAQIEEELYQFSLRAEDETLFGLCREFHDLCDPKARTIALPPNEEFRLLRLARTLVNEEFAEPLSLQANVVEYDLYRYAVNSENDNLFDLYTELMALPDKLETSAFEGMPLLLSKDEFVALRNARRLIREEFGEVLALESEHVLDALYGFALDSESEALFDIHAELNADAVEVERNEVGPVPKVARKPEIAVFETEKPAEPAVVEAPPATTPTGLRRFLSVFNSPAEDAPEPSHASTARDSDEAEQNVDRQGEPDKTPQTNEDLPPADEPPIGEVTVAEAPAKRPKPDMIPRAMSQQNANPLQPRDRDDHEKPAGAELPSQPKVSLPPLSSVTVDSSQGWYVATLDERLRVRLSSELSLSSTGELMLFADEDEPLGAVINLSEEGPILIPKTTGLLINNEPADNQNILEHGDKITVAGATLFVEYAKDEGQSLGELSSSQS